MVGHDSCPELNLTMGFMLAFCYKETPYELHQKNMADYDSLLASYRLRRRFANCPD